MKKPTSKDVAKLAGVSQATVSFVLNNREDVTIPEHTRQKVIEAAKKINYIPNLFAKGLKTNKSKLMGLIVPTIANPFYPMLTQSIEEYAFSKGYNVLLCNTYRRPENEEKYIKLLLEKAVDGIIYCFTPNYPEYIKSINKQIPVVIIGESESDIDTYTIALNSYKAGQIIANHLVELGHKSIAYISSPINNITKSRQKRLNGIMSVIKSNGLEKSFVIKAETLEYESNDSSYEIEIGYELTSKLLKESSVTAVIGVNDMVAFGALNAIQQNGFKVPRDISVCGFDNIYLSRVLNPKITTVDHHSLHRSKQAVDILIEKIEETTHDDSIFKVEYEPKLIVRESTGPLKKA